MLSNKTLTIASATLLVLVTGCSKQVSFTQDVQPIIKDRCLTCHMTGGKGFIKSGLNMESYEGLMKGTSLGPIIVPGDSVSSTLVRLIEHKADATINMPHGEAPLTAAQIDTINQWIDQGAKNN